MDTIENTNAPVGAEGATSSQDTALQVDTQPSEAEEVVSDNQSGEEGEQAPETLLAGKYKNAQELEKAYKELERSVGQASQKAALVNKLEKTTGMSSQQIADFLNQQEQERLTQQYQENPTAYTMQKIQELESKLSLQNEERELDKFLETNPDYKPFRDKILKLALTSETDKGYEDIAKEWFGETRAQGQQDAYKKIETKKMTQTTGSQSAPQKKFSAEDMKNMSVAELEAILPHAPQRL